MSNQLFARYSESFNEFLNNYPTYLTDTISFGTSEQTKSLIDMIKSVWNIYEISGETEDEFKVFFSDTFNEFKDYYLDIITNYEKSFDYTIANKKIRTLTETENTKENGNNTRKVTDDGLNTKYDLPNKPTTTEYPTTKISDTNENNDNSAYSSAKDKGKDTTDTTIYNNEYIKLKNEYLKQIKSYYHEFAMKFSDCFVHIY